MHGTLGTPGRPLYFLHLPKTAGSAFTRMLDDAFPVGARVPGQFFEALGGTPLTEALRKHGLLAGHFGVRPLALAPLTTVTVLREPAARTSSHFKYMAEQGREHTFETFMADPVAGLGARDYQARWLGTPNAERPPDGAPASAYLPTTPGGGHGAPPPAALERAAAATLAGCALAGTAERLPATIDALGRLLGGPLALPPRVNVTRDASPLPPEAAARIRALSPVDLRLHAEAGRRLDRALAALPPLPPEPVVPLPCAQGLEAGLHGTGFHRRTHAPGAAGTAGRGRGAAARSASPCGSPGPRRSRSRSSGVRRRRRALAAARGPGRARRPPARDAAGRSRGLAVADVALDPRRPLTVGLEIAHTRHLVDAATGARSPDAAGLALATIAFR